MKQRSYGAIAWAVNNVGANVMCLLDVMSQDDMA